MSGTMLTTRPAHERRLSSTDDEDDIQNDPGLEQRQADMRNKVRSECFDVLHDAYRNQDSALSFKDITDYMKGLEEGSIASARDHQEKMEWLGGMKKEARVFARETVDVGSRLMQAIRDAKGDDISDASLERWQNRLKERPNGEQWPDTRRKMEEFIRRELPTLRKEWKLLGSDIKEVKGMMNALGVTSADVKELAALEDPSFKSAKFPDRRTKVTAALRALRDRKKNWKKRPKQETEGTKMYDDVRMYLLEMADAGAMSRAKVGAWMKRTFATKDLEKARTFLRTTVRPCAENWKRVRGTFDQLHAEMAKTGVPRGFTPYGPEAFLEKTYPQREAYVQMLEARLRLAGKPVSQHVSDIWSSLDQKHWYDAERLLGELEKNFPHTPGMGAMLTYLETHRDDAEERSQEAKEVKSDKEIWTETNGIINEYPEMDIVLEKSITDDTTHPADQNKRTRLVGRMMYNLVWAEQRGYTSEEEQLEDINDDDHKKKTEEFIEDGHSNEVEKNMVWGKTADKQAIRKECTSAQIIYMKPEPEAQHSVYNALEADELWSNEKFGYWSDLKVVGMPTGKHHHFVNHDSKKLKNLMWQMKDRGMVFSREDVKYREGAQSAKKEKPSEEKPEKKTGKPEAVLA